jgi:tRNA isopentenyl-2-thiomethyl-A-37 hydroxylase MiaE
MNDMFNAATAALNAKVDALQAERDMYKATAEAVACMHCFKGKAELINQLAIVRSNLADVLRKNDDLRTQLEAARVNAERYLKALKEISRTEYHIERPPVFSLAEQMRKIARQATKGTTE